MPNRTRDHLANERTLLAWIRTGVTLIGLGFVVARFSYVLLTLSAEARSKPPSSGGTAFGVALVVGGAAAILIALRRFVQTRAQIDQGDYRSGAFALITLGLLSAAVAIGLAVYIGVSGQTGG